MNPSTTNPQKIYGLDGLRFFSFVAVIINHVYDYLHYYGYTFNKPDWVKAAGVYGVEYFFAGSGFLITYMLLAEKEKTGRFNIRYFYLRRIFRIWPAYYLLLLLVYLLVYQWHWFDIPVLTEMFTPWQGKSLLLFLCFMPHLAAMTGIPAAPYLDHTYTIGIEEQFYLVWAILFRFFSKYFFRFILLLLVIGITLSVVHYCFYFPIRNSVFSFINPAAVFFNYSQFTTFAIGSFIAVYYKSNHQTLGIFKNKWFQLGFYVLLFLLIYFNVKTPFLYYEWVTIQVGILLLIATYPGSSIIPYSHSVAEYLGRISYGVYLFHYIAITICIKYFVFAGKMDIFKPVNFVVLVFLSVLLSVLFGLVSYYTIEQYFMRIKNRFRAGSTNKNFENN
jgi:peptidoglycan/LPS O-acetylase OafA/YrhL